MAVSGPPVTVSGAVGGCLPRFAGGRLTGPRHFQELYFGTGKNTESLKKYYEKQSSGRYSVE
ncbi:immune inhibitor A domain-containing protein, partial [Streptomyces sp. NPDC052127]|uniref:immune inhibitor A domain-containing protein n=1 Tax=Streptomyces sp. NPDC052127 TaxID=3155679 RepID=UPI00343B2998